MNILITGATGFIGKELTNALLKAGNNITVISTKPETATSVFEKPVSAIGWNISNVELAKIISGCQAVINLAGADISAKPWNSAYKRIMESSRIKTTKKLVDAIDMTQSKPEVFIQGSAIGYYGNHPDKSFDENTPKGEGYLPDLVEKWENAAKPLTKMGIRVAWIRTGVVMGKQGGMLKKLELPFRLFAGGPPGKGKQWLSWIDIRDEVRAIIFILNEQDMQGKFNLTTPDPMQMKDYLKEFGKVLHRPSWFNIPKMFLKMAFGERADALLLASQKVMPSNLLKHRFEFHFADARKSLESMYRKTYGV